MRGASLDAASQYGADFQNLLGERGELRNTLLPRITSLADSTGYSDADKASMTGATQKSSKCRPA